MRGNKLQACAIAMACIAFLLTEGCHEAKRELVESQSVSDSEMARRDSMREWLQSDEYREIQQKKAEPLEYIKIKSVDQKESGETGVLEIYTTIENKGVRQLRQLHLQYDFVNAKGISIGSTVKVSDIILNPGETKKLGPLKFVFASESTQEKIKDIKHGAIKVHKRNGVFRAVPDVKN